MALRLLFRLLLVTALGIASVTAVQPRWFQLDGYTYTQYLKDFNRLAILDNPVEFALREQRFSQRLKDIRAHNSRPGVTWRRGVNAFTDRFDHELPARRMGGKSEAATVSERVTSWQKDNLLHREAAVKEAFPHLVHHRSVNHAQSGAALLPLEVDYRTSLPPVLSPIYNQGYCGNCWAWGATQSIESYFALQTGRLVQLSTQQMTSCALNFSFLCGGCQGGSAVGGWAYVNSTEEGLRDAAVYPFTDFFQMNLTERPNSTSTCAQDRLHPSKTANPTPILLEDTTRVGVSGFTQVASNDALAVQEVLATTGPLTIGVGTWSWEDYESGIFQNVNVGDFLIDHEVQMVGYGYDPEVRERYWLVKNSWGTTWGEDGFIRLYRAPTPQQEPCAPNGTFLEPICGTCGCLFTTKFPHVFEAD
jgi:hypothetical protein